MEEVTWRLRAKVKWLKEGDCNIGFFHRTACFKKTFISGILIDGNFSTEDQKVMEEFYTFY